MAVEIKRSGSTVTISSLPKTAVVRDVPSKVEVNSESESVSTVSVNDSADVFSRSWGCDVFSGIIVGGSRYEGDYEVTPTAIGEVLQTKLKTMLDDVTVQPIPYQETTNASGGYTISIAS